jgi:hypothetical protein
MLVETPAVPVSRTSSSSMDSNLKMSEAGWCCRQTRVSRAKTVRATTERIGWCVPARHRAQAPRSSTSAGGHRSQPLGEFVERGGGRNGADRLALAEKLDQHLLLGPLDTPSMGPRSIDRGTGQMAATKENLPIGFNEAPKGSAEQTSLSYSQNFPLTSTIVSDTIQ